MSQVVYARPGTIARAPQTNLEGQAPENVLNAMLYQWTAALCDEEI
jgi:hypothetical protein